MLWLEVVGQELDEFYHVVVGYLVAEHVYKLDASSSKHGKVVKRGTFLYLKFRHDELLNVCFEQLWRDTHLGSAMLECVAADTGSNDQVNDCDHLLPIVLLVAGVLSLHRRDEASNECADFLLKHWR